MSRFACLYGLIVLLVAGSLSADDWPQWRGPNRDGRSTESGLSSQWPEGGPAVDWHVENAGVGYSSLVVKDGRVFTQGDLEGVEHILCFSEEDGSLIWAVQPEPVRTALTARIDQEFARYDKNSDGTIDPIESLELGRNLAGESESGDDPGETARTRSSVLFAALDTDENGRLTYTEVPPQVARTFFDRADQPDPDADVDELAAARTAAALELDADENGRISREESRRTQVDADFNRIDQRLPGERRGDGELTAEELTEFFTKQRPGRDGQLTSEELAAWLKRDLPNRDGVVTIEDLTRMFGGYRNGQGDGPRGTPAVDGKFVYVEGGNGDVSCLKTDTGETIWHVNLASDLGGGRPGWGYSESPLVIDDYLIVTPGGRDGTLAALDKQTGEVVWRTTEIAQAAHYSSPISAYVAGERQVVQFARESVFGVSLEDGRPLWSYSGAANGTANCSTPIIDGDFILAASAYGTGGGLVKVSGTATEQQAEELYFEKALQNHHGGMVKVGEYVYGTGSNTLICMHFETGEIAWQNRAAGKGSLVYADGHLYCLGERNQVALVEASPDEYIEKGRFEIPSTGRPSWAHPVVANGRFYIRDQNRLTAYDVRAK